MTFLTKKLKRVQLKSGNDCDVDMLAARSASGREQWGRLQVEGD